MTNQTIHISTPGRICLFGEHQDYLGLPVIAAAISLRVSICGTLRNDRLVHIALPDLKTSEEFDLNGNLSYRRERDYFRSAVRVMQKNGFTFPAGFTCEVHGKLPINAGASSSTALVVSWIHFLGLASAQKKLLSPMECARLAHQAEVVEFSEPGGMMDHYSTALGGTVMITFKPVPAFSRIPLSGVPVVLGDSGEPKDTMNILCTVKRELLAVTRALRKQNKTFSLGSLTRETVRQYKRALSLREYAILHATVDNHMITRTAASLLERGTHDIDAIGDLLCRHQENLRIVLGISTPKIDRMVDAAMSAGAAGAKINGSGGGGCMFALAPKDPYVVAEAIARAGGKAYVVSIDTGSRLDSPAMMSNGQATI